MPHWFWIIFLFMLGASVGSFLNVVVWRLPRGKSLVHPPSACPKCNHPLAWKDNIPVFGWIFLRGKCRYCGVPISARYPIIEAITGLLVVGYYIAIFIYGMGPSITSYDAFGVPEYATLRSLELDWPIFGLLMFMICGLLAASLIDAELYIIPISIPWTVAIVAFVVHPLIASPVHAVPGQVGALWVGPIGGAAAVTIAVGLLISNLLLWLKVIPQSFPKGEPLLDWERQEMEQQLKDKNADPGEFAELPPVATKAEIRRQMALELLFLTPAAVLCIAAMVILVKSPPTYVWWRDLLRDNDWLRGLLGSVLGAIVAGGLIWGARIGATLALGRVGMGQGDTHLMVGIGAALGVGPSIVVFFIAPFCGLVIGIYKLMVKGARELPYGPYLSLAAAAVILVYRPIEAYFAPHLQIIGQMLAEWLGLGA